MYPIQNESKFGQIAESPALNQVRVARKRNVPFSSNVHAFLGCISLSSRECLHVDSLQRAVTQSITWRWKWKWKECRTGTAGCLFRCRLPVTENSPEWSYLGDRNVVHLSTQNLSMASPLDAFQQHVVTDADLACGLQDKPHQWVQVAARVFPELGTVSKAKRARKAGNLLFNGQSQVPTITRAAVNDILSYRSSEKHQLITSGGVGDSGIQSWLRTCKTQGLRVVYECSTMAVVVKPVGIHVKGRGKRTVEQALPLLLQRHQTIDVDDFKLPIPHAVHRLDYRVGGLLLVAKTRKMEVELSAQLERHSVTKQYRAILVGNVNDKFARRGGSCSVVKSIGLPRPFMEIQDELLFLDDPIDGKPCLTAIRVVNTTRSARYGWISTVDLWPLTGRKHQLRIHTAQHGHPIIGDDLYHDTIRIEGHQEGDYRNAVQLQSEVVRGMGLFLFSVAVAFDDAAGNRRNFQIDEPNKFARFRHFCELNWTKKDARQDQDDDKLNT
ncbi:Ribosomal large subunit pseudouridine synthase C [Phytophthora citrophthora]|uniref:Ribosomal large subunit pseudouridine synthase C n=1 Tax=Phytophthora citrophthora TaxID=4793 RepID=A0AAD9GWP3_9STRA|nr:Ribosomal large subunit pseudouridine synthase C [Phytophthora citrophthora]